MIAIHDNTELAKFGFDGAAFRRYTSDKIGGYEWHGPCPRCPGSINKMVVSNGFYWCRDYKAHSGRLDRMGSVEITEEDKRKAWEAGQKAEREKAEKRNRNIAYINRNRLWEKFHNNIWSNLGVIDHLAKDGVTTSMIAQYQIGYDPQFRVWDWDKKKAVYVPAISWPIFDSNSGCLNIRMRLLDNYYARTKGKYLPYRLYLPQAFFPAFDPYDHWCVIVEGEKKAAVMRRFGFPSAGLFGVNNFSKEWIPWFRNQFRQLFVMFDGDNPGVVATAKRLAKQLGAKPVFPPGKPDDLLVAGHLTTPEMRCLLEA